ncbi:MAG TPA: trehalose-6-phosphate synthase [Actinomycetota bacterium]|nr:trehalose-6-phosphate synthase [Actinomycetota bacterium]
MGAGRPVAPSDPERAGPSDRGRVVVASNRGPVTFVPDEAGRPVPRRGVGGLVSALTGALQRTGGLWVAAAMSDLDRELAARGRLDVAELGWNFGVRSLVVDPETYDRFYNGVSNRVLWFLHHYLWDVPRAPSFGPQEREAWEAYRKVNRTFARALAEEGEAQGGPAYLVQDYHLSLVPAALRELRPGAPVAHFFHIPFADPTYVRLLPTALRRELLAGMLGADVLGFHTERWARNFLGCCEAEGIRVDRRRRAVSWQGREVRVRPYPLGADVEGLAAAADTPEARAALAELEAWRGEARLVLRVDRAELSKNILRGFLAFELFLRRYPEWRGRVRFLALLNPSRGDLEEYAAYVEQCLAVAERVNRELGSGGWRPLEVSLKDDFPRAVAAYQLYDVLLVNPVFDGMNLVAKEGPVLNRRDGVLVLSENAGAFEEVGRYAVRVNPFDVLETAEAIAAALAMDREERARRARALRRAVRRNPLERWVEAQLADLEDARRRG